MLSNSADLSKAHDCLAGDPDQKPLDVRKDRSLETEKPTAFISYSRKDIDFVGRLNTALDARGIDARIDREDIEKSAEWWSRIQQLISEADTIVFVLSPDSALSSTCQEEVNFAESLKKRLIPIVVRDLAGQTVPTSLARLNYIFFTANQAVGATGDFDAAVEDLVWAIETNITWIREHTRLGTLAGRWEVLGHPHELELRGQELSRAESWLITRPSNAPDPTDAHRAFIRASQQLAARQQRLLVSSLSAGLAVFIGLTIFAVFRQQEAEEQAALALTSSSESSFRSNQQLSALLASIKAGRILKNRIVPVQGHTFLKVVLSLRQAVYGSREANRFEGEHAQSSNVLSIRYSPDGKIIASGDTGDSVMLWKADGTIHKRLSFPTQLILGLSFSPDSKEIAAIDRGNRVTIWTTSDGRPSKENLTSLTYSGPQMGLGLGVASENYYADVWHKLWGKQGENINTSSAIINKIFSKKKVNVDYFLLKLSPNGKFFVVSIGRFLEKWSVEGSFIRAIGMHNGDVTDIDFSPDSKLFASAGKDNTIKVWRSEGGNLLSIGDKIDGNQAAVTSLKFSQDGKLLISLDRNGAGKIWDSSRFLENQVSLLNTFVWDAPDSENPPISFSPDGKYFAAGYSSGQIKTWSIDSLQPKTYTHRDACATFDESIVDFSPDGTILVSSGCYDIRIWGANGELKKSIVYQDPLQKPLISFSSDSKKILVSTSNFDKPHLYSANWNRIKEFSTPGFAALSPDGELVAFVNGETIQLQNLKEKVVKTFKLPKNPATECPGRIKFSDDGQIILVLGTHSVCLLNVTDGSVKPVKSLGGRTRIQDVSLSSDKKTLAIANFSNTVTLYDANKDMGLPPKVLVGHTGPVDSVRFSADNSSIITSSSRDGTIRFWESNGRLINLINANGPSSIDLSPNGQSLVSVRGNALTFWNLDLDDLLSLGCKHVANYLNNPNTNLSQDDRKVCQGL